MPRPPLKLAFRPRARILQLLGDQLIGSPRLAVFELVKNAYDADAKNVTVSLEHLETPEATIIVEDNGSGMSLDTIRDIWLVPADDHRELQREALRRTTMGRLPLGEKGLGRFAVHKLGDRIELVTRSHKKLECVVVIDWAAMIAKRFLKDARVTVLTRKPIVFTGAKTGTKLTITKLKEARWSKGDVRRLFRQVTSISSPFSGRNNEFVASLLVPEHPQWVAGIPDIEAILERAPWEFSFLFEGGRIEWSYRFKGVSGIPLEPRRVEKGPEHLKIVQDKDVGEFGENQHLKSSKPKPVIVDEGIAEGIGPVSGTLYVFDRDPYVLRALGDSALVQNVLDENGGVRVYRDQMRVYNYGEPGDDWLGLDLRRINTPTKNISRNIVVGAIDLELEHSEQLREKTNREGFVENDAYRRLRQIVLGALALLEIERKIDKENLRMVTGEGRDPETRRIAEPLLKLKKIARKHHLSVEIDPLVDQVERNYNEMRDTMLRAGLSGIGLAVVFHEIEQGVRVLSDAIESGGAKELVQTQAKELVRILDGFTELLRKGDRKSNSIRHLLKRVRDINLVRFRKHGVTLVCPAFEEEGSAPEAIFAFGLMMGALNNLLDNAFYWLQVRWPGDGDGDRKIFLNIDKDFSEGITIVVADNGPGLQDPADRLTTPFFSRRPDGMGIGLYYTNLVMELNNGRLAFPLPHEVDLPPEFDGAAFALVFPKKRAH